MNKEHYARIMNWGDEHTKEKKGLCSLNHGLPLLLALIYGGVILRCLFFSPMQLTHLILRPVICFLLATFLRKILKFPRPYDVYQIPPMCDYKPGKNRSLPSRHTAAAFIIAFEVCRIIQPIGILCMILSVLIGSLRVICGNHFIKDVLSAFILALVIFLV